MEVMGQTSASTKECDNRSTGMDLLDLLRQVVYTLRSAATGLTLRKQTKILLRQIFSFLAIRRQAASAPDPACCPYQIQVKQRLPCSQ
eukprot:5551712-Amphidinium_carterae.1